ncbi:hypothetical protein [Streptomyces sp. NPDC006668]|uniref:hypothetical protein n=1 Tax=Streptomyces sp. NPDC006668 TaxID=3156903 RepID=UPI0033F713C8
MAVDELAGGGDLKRGGGAQWPCARRAATRVSSGEVEHRVMCVHGCAKLRAVQAALGPGLKLVQADRTAPDAVDDSVHAIQTEL